MRVNETCYFQIIDDRTLKITSADCLISESIALSPSFIQEKLPAPTESKTPDRTANNWSLISIDNRGETVVKAIKLSEVQLLVNRNESFRGYDVIEGAREGSTEKVTDLLRTGHISDTHRSAAILKAIELREINMVKSLLASGKIDSLDRTLAIKKAAELGDLKIVLLLIKDASCLWDNYGDALNGAVEGGQEDVVDTLPSSTEISDPDLTTRDWSLINIDAGFGVVLKALSISKLHLLVDRVEKQVEDLPITHATKNGQTEIVKSLLLSSSINREDLVIAAQEAAFAGHLEILKLLMLKCESMGLAPSDDSHKGIPLVFGAKGGHAEIVTWLLTGSVFSSYFVHQALEEASKNGHEECIIALLNSRCIPDDSRGNATLFAARAGYERIVKILINSGSISNYHGGLAIIAAAERGDAEIVKVLLTSNGVIFCDRNEAIRIAASRGYNSVVTTILDTLTILNFDFDARGFAIFSALQGAQRDLALLLLENGSISADYRGQALIYSAQKGYKEMISPLLKRGFFSNIFGMAVISETDRAEAIKAAIEHRHIEILDLLRGLPMEAPDTVSSAPAYLSDPRLKTIKLKME